MTHGDMETKTLPELFETEAAPHRERRRRRRKSRFKIVRRVRRQLRNINWRIATLLVVGVVAVIIMAVLVLTFNARNRINDSWQSVERVWTTVNNTPGTELTYVDFERLQASLSDFNQSLASARSQTRVLRPLAFASADLDTSLTVLDTSQELTQAANTMLTGLQPTLFYLAEGEEETLAPQLSSGERTVELLVLGQGQFTRAQQHLDTAATLLDDLPLADVSGDLVVTVDELRAFHEQLSDINRTLTSASTLLTEALGLNETQTYLVLSQNSDELRPSGGFISTYGWLQVRNGRIVGYSYSPTSDTSPKPPAAEFRSEIDVPEWWIPHGNPLNAAWAGSWYADFPSTAQMAAWYYDAGRNIHAPVDGVIAIDLVAFEYIMEGLGEVTLPAYDVIVTPENFREMVYSIRSTGEGPTPHKRFLAALYQQIFDDWQSVDQKESIDLRGALLRALQEKHIMLYFQDQSINDAIDVLGWSGAQGSGVDHDYLMVADANLGSKSNRSILRQITYDVVVQPEGTLRSTASIGYEYSARLAEDDPAVRPEHYYDIDYSNLMQVFVPAGSTLTGTNNLRIAARAVPTDERTIFTTLTQVEYDTSERFQFSYETPVLVERFGPYRRYTLRLEKQPGTISDVANVTVSLPPGAQIIHVDPAPAASFVLDNPILEFRLELLTDHTIEIIYTG